MSTIEGEFGIYMGLIGSMAGSIVQIVAFNKIGTAGEELIKAGAEIQRINKN